MFMMAKMWGDPKKTPNTPEDLWKLPGDANTSMTEEDIAQIFANLRSKEANG